MFKDDKRTNGWTRPIPIFPRFCYCGVRNKNYELRIILFSDCLQCDYYNAQNDNEYIYFKFIYINLTKQHSRVYKRLNNNSSKLNLT